MTNSEIKVLRDAMGLSQGDFGRLLGAHAMTVSKWERGVSPPTPYQLALMQEFRRAADKRRAEVDQQVRAVLIGAGVAAALLLLLNFANESKDA